ncbi:MAG: FAD-dependent oxidoreductase [Candidatus Eremiobacteraeota bacterium]|nr:FAD-dependent oxidoreductase [Candidatus Eremiobacteraeota bacterium]
MMLGYLLARAGIPVTVLEKHADFLRDFRGDTIHPSTLQLMYELGILGDFLALPHNEIRQLRGRIGESEITLADFTHLPTHTHFMALMPQWDFLNFLAEKATTFPAFTLRTKVEATGLLRDGEKVVGVRAKSEQGDEELYADLVVGCDGRKSTIRAAAGLPTEDLGAPMDVIWLRVSKSPDDPSQTFGNIENGRILVTLNRSTYWQVAYVIPKDEFPQIQAAGIEAFRKNVGETAPYLADRMVEITDWSQVSLLTVRVDRLTKWYPPGLLCIGDAAHAMSPIGGVGINLAIQDAVATANLLYPALRDGALTTNDLAKVQARRTFPTKFTQRAQVLIQNNIIKRVLGGSTVAKAPAFLRMIDRFPVLQRIPARIVGLGVRPEHVQTPAVAQPRASS